MKNIECFIGDIPILFISSMDGNLKFFSINKEYPNSYRNYGINNFLFKLIDLFKNNLNKKPYLLKCNIHPSYLDLNKTKYKNKLIRNYYKEFYKYIDNVIIDCITKYDKILIFDFYTHYYKHKLVELNYDVNKNLFDKNYEVTFCSSLSNFYKNHNIIDSINSFGEILCKNNIFTIPSKNLKNIEYFSKAKNIIKKYKYFLKDVGIIQVEIYFKYIRFLEYHPDFVFNFYNSINKFFKIL